MRSQSGGALNFEITLYADRNEAPVNNTVVKYPPPYPYGWNNTGWFNWIWTNSSNWVFAECIFQFTSITQLYLNKTQTKKNTNFAVLFFLFLSSVSVFRFRFCFNKFEQRNFNVIVVYLSLFWKQYFLFFWFNNRFSIEWMTHSFVSPASNSRTPKPSLCGHRPLSRSFPVLSFNSKCCVTWAHLLIRSDL